MNTGDSDWMSDNSIFVVKIVYIHLLFTLGCLHNSCCFGDTVPRMSKCY